MSTALDSLARFVEERPEGGAGSRRWLQGVLKYLKRCYGPTPAEAIASDEMPQAADALTLLFREVTLGELVNGAARAKLPIPLKHWCVSLKLRDQLGTDYVTDLEYRIGKKGSFDVYADDVKIATLAELGANIYRTNFEKGVLVVEAQIAPPFLFPADALSFRWSAWQQLHPAEDTGEYAGYHLFGHIFARGRYLRMSVAAPPTFPRTTVTIRAELNTDDAAIMSAALSFGYRGASHLARVRGLRWERGGFMFRADQRAIHVTPTRRFDRLKNELTIAAAVFARVWNRKTPARHLKVVVIRALYWITKSAYERKNIWLLHDKMYSASDCGEYMYWYLHENADDIHPVYAVNQDATEAPRLRSSGADLVYPGTIRLALNYLHAKVIFTTHPNPATTTGFTKLGVFLRDLNNAPIVCIQHGLSMQELGRSMHQGHAGIERYYCASPYEIENIGTPEYGYTPDQLVLTGIPRFDGLPSDSERILMISPTWRPEYAAPSPGENNRRPANESFLESLYFDRFSRLLTDRSLLEACRDAGFQIRFMLHPTLATNHEYFRDGLREFSELKDVSALVDDLVTVVAAGIDTSYDSELKRARVLVTDYSGIQYDFAYMRKALVYFHDEEMPPQYGNGAMRYEEIGFGPIARTVGELSVRLREVLADDGVVPAGYVERYESFFAFDDRDSSGRIYRDVAAWLAERAAEPELTSLDEVPPAELIEEEALQDRSI